ncbi:glycosyltransferase family 2 protein [Algoriphagus chordae]|uniref:Glycosyltransferase involved in cell wall biosynthesis n=1 Tax=Algoriphagus chordae TaxID=237019 RepID=A0A2W7QNL9_9BACT|nr:glycosyltransferase family 2 protein [Algoriphagus chordae]PZX47640.1 glycosyltransferase involved in cell wall biosynthesis [Algoriphagus chordae]
MILTVVTINYNNASGLRRTIASVFNQTFRDFEYVIVDGDSTDGSVALLKENRSNIQQLLVEPDNGIYQAMNKGISLAQGQYLLFLNSGDEFASDHILEDMHGYLKDEDIIYGDVIWRDNLVTCYPPVLNFSFLKNRSLPHQGTFIKKSLFDTCGYYDEDLLITSDWKFFLLSICKINSSYSKIPFVISRMEPGGISDSQVRDTSSIIFKEKAKVLSEHFPAFLADYDQFSKRLKAFRFLKLKFWKRYFSDYRQSTAVSKYDW